MSRFLPLHTLPWRATRNASRNLLATLHFLVIQLPNFHYVRNTKRSHTPRTLTIAFYQKLIGINRKAYWPVHFTSKVNQPQNIIVGIESCPGYEPGCYIQGLGKVVIGDYVRIAQNVGIISANHLVDNPHEHDKTQTVEIGSFSWVGMNAVILPGVKLGEFTIVGAGSVVTKSFPEGHCVLAGNPAKVIRQLDADQCVRTRCEPEYVGYIPAEDFEEYRVNNLWV